MEENNLKITTTKEKTKTIAALITIILLFLFLLIVTFVYFNSPRRKFISNFTKAYSELLEKASSNKLTSILNNNIVGVNGETSINLKFSDELFGEEKEIIELIDSLKKIDLSYDYKEDKINKVATLDFDSKLTNKDFIKFNGIVKDNKLYFNLKNLLNKYFYTDLEFTSLFDTIDEKDTEYVLAILKDVIIEKVTSEYFSSEKTTITINDKTEKVEKISLNLNNELIKDVVTSIIDKLKSDEKAMDILVKYNKIDKKELIELFESTKESLNDITSNENYFYNMYVKGSKTLRHEFIYDTAKIEYNAYGNIDEFKIISDSSELGTLNFKHEGDITTITGNFSTIFTINGNYTNNKLNLVLGVMGNEMAKLDIATTENVSNDKIDTTVSVTVVITEAQTEMINIGITSKNTIKKETTINNQIPSNSVDANSISKEDQQTLTNNLMKLPLIGDAMNIYIQKMNTGVKPMLPTEY